MIKTLQRKFILTAMTAITVLIAVILSGVNIFNYGRIKKENSRMLDMLFMSEDMSVPEDIRENDIFEDNLPSDVHMEEMRPEKGVKDDFFDHKITEDNFMSARFFVVRVSYDGEVSYVDISRISSISEDEAKEYAADIVSDDKKEGTKDGFTYRVEKTKDGQGMMLIALYNSQQNKDIFFVLIISCATGILSWLIMLVAVTLMSKKSIRPIAENIDKQKTFVTDAGHEIKTPLAIIMANVDAMELHNGENKWSKNIRNQTERLTGLMKKLLTLSRMEEGNVSVGIEVDFSDLAEKIVDGFTETAKKKGISIYTGIEKDIRITADPEHITELLTILLDNAIKYSPNDKKINVELRQKGKAVKLLVSNHCKEISKEEQERLFDRFYRTDSARTHQNGGYGIGLSVAKAIVEIYHGKIETGYSNGVITFEVEL